MGPVLSISCFQVGKVFGFTIFYISNWKQFKWISSITPCLPSQLWELNPHNVGETKMQLQTLEIKFHAITNLEQECEKNFIIPHPGDSGSTRSMAYITNESKVWKWELLGHRWAWRIHHCLSRLLVLLSSNMRIRQCHLVWDQDVIATSILFLKLSFKSWFFRASDNSITCCGWNTSSAACVQTAAVLSLGTGVQMVGLWGEEVVRSLWLRPKVSEWTWLAASADMQDG